MDLATRLKEIKDALKAGLKHQGPWHDRLPEFSIVDRVEIKIVPRFKTSGLSGNEWRQNISVVGYFKGEVVFTERCGDMDYALASVYSFYKHTSIPKVVLQKEKECCDQPSCMNKATNRYLMKKVHSEGNHFEANAMKKSHGQGYYRQFCDIHAERGDACLNDTDSNYLPIEGGPGNSTNLDSSPSGGPIVMDL